MDSIFRTVDARLIVAVIVLALVVIVGSIAVTGWLDRRRQDGAEGPDDEPTKP
ncbi:MAG: hypothetical protein QOK05_2120 [Chloroflexota bacterium]|jgi:cell division septation protein DedD|nr:hypothetical protein [Chloroflexota bacterium]